MGDFNINLDPEKRQTETWLYLETLLVFGLFPVITKPSRVTVNVDNQLLFDNHINQLRTTVSRAVGIMTKIRQFVPSQILKQIYFAFIHSHLTYMAL